MTRSGYVVRAARRLRSLVALLGFAASAAAAATRDVPADLSRLESSHVELLARYRPDLAANWGVELPPGITFVGLSEPTIEAHVRLLRAMLTQVKALPANARSESLCTRLEWQIAEADKGGALRRDALLWLDIVAAAARAPLTTGPASGCSRTNRVTRQLRAVPEALRSAAILMRGAHPPNPRAFEDRVGRVEWLFRRDLPARTEVCKEPRRLVEFARADTLAARALATFRRRVITGP
jgi:hypothetical protein